jgi:hypothetical protein
VATNKDYFEAVKSEILSFDPEVKIIDRLVQKTADYFEGSDYSIEDLKGDGEKSEVYFAYDVLLFTDDI